LFIFYFFWIDLFISPDGLYLGCYYEKTLKIINIKTKKEVTYQGKENINQAVFRYVDPDKSEDTEFVVVMVVEKSKTYNMIVLDQKFSEISREIIK
jgi:hypothetical protein